MAFPARPIQRWLRGILHTRPTLAETLEPPLPDDVLELDEVWSFVGNKGHKRWLWIALCRRTRQIVAFTLGDRVDALDKQRLTASNVVVVFAHHLYTDIRESSNFYSLEIQFWGQGPVRVFRAGLFQLVDAAGAVIPLKPGRTWFEFAPLDSVIEMSEGQWAIEATILPQQTPPKP